MVRTLRVSVLLAVLLAALPYPAAAADPLAVSFTVVRETPVSVTIRATITGADGPLQVTAQVDDYHSTTAPAVKAVQVQSVERVAEYRDTPEYDTKRIPIAEKLATLEAEVDVLGVRPKGEGKAEEAQRQEQREAKQGELDALLEQEQHGATWTEEQVLVAHRYALRYREERSTVATVDDGATVLLPAQASQDAPPATLISDEALDLDSTTVNWAEDTRVYEYTIMTGEVTSADGGYGSAGILVLTINGRDYYDDTHSSWWDTSWPYRMKLTIDNSASTEDLIDFPLMVQLTPERFDYSFAQVDGDDIRFVDSDGTALDYECDTWTLDGDSWFWVRVPQIDAGSDTDYIWMYWGTPTVANGENAEGVWPTDIWAAVYHMNDDDAGTGILDSTANGNDGTKGAGAAAPTEVAGLLGMAQALSYANATYIEIPDDASLNITGAHTIIALFQTTENWTPLTNDYKNIYQRGAFASGRYGLRIYEHSTNVKTYPESQIANSGVGSGSYNLWAPTVDVPDDWGTSGVLLGNSVDASYNRLWIDGAQVATATSLYPGSFSGVARIGYANATFKAPDINLCALWICSTALSADEIAALDASMRLDSLVTYGDAEGPVIPAETEPAVALPMALLCVGVALSAVRQRHIILYLAAFILLLFLGFDTFEASLPMAIMAFTYAGYMLYSMSTWFWSTR